MMDRNAAIFAVIVKLHFQWKRREELALAPEEYALVRIAVAEWDTILNLPPWPDGKIYFKANDEPIGSPLRLVTVVGVLDYQI